MKKYFITAQCPFCKCNNGWFRILQRKLCGVKLLNIKINQTKESKRKQTNKTIDEPNTNNSAFFTGGATIRHPL